MQPVSDLLGSRVKQRAIPHKCSESRWFARDGWPIRRVDWPVSGPVRGSMLFVPGRGDFLEKYLESLNQWNDSGWEVTALDWRGQALSGRLGIDSKTGHIPDFGIWVDDLAAFWAEWTAATPVPHVLVAHSMGGHLALRAAAEGGIAPAALVLSAPMLGFVRHGLPPILSRALARFMCAIGDPRRPGWGRGEKPGLRKDRQALLTHDAARYADECWWRETRPELDMGPPSWGWLRAALVSMAALDRPDVLARVAVRTLFAATDADRLVDYGAIARAAGWIPGARLLRFGPEARHELLRESDPVRDRLLASIDEFLDQAAPTPK
ncbi:MAG TPA: alpha/beta hydrolase [Novosphingobium sp.]|nr:alpha/beta hydrolase [Novosphingobium sp.]